MSALVISLDFELFWGVADSRNIASYRSNIEGEWDVIPKILELFEQNDVRATWATVGMLMCRNYSQWCEIRPDSPPEYLQKNLSNYRLDSVIKDNPSLFFARSLVQQILDTPGQEIASHSYSHFYCGEKFATIQQFAADLLCAIHVANDLGIKYKSFVFPRNQVQNCYVSALHAMGFKVFRGNASNWLYERGDSVAFGLAGRALRLVDSYLPLSGNQIANPSIFGGLVDVPASLFLRPWSNKLSTFEKFRIIRIKNAMTSAAKDDGVFHLWWHPHNFGVNIEKNILILKSIIDHYVYLRDIYGMQSLQMGDFAIE